MLIVDGYNVLMQMGLKDKTLEARRNHFVRILNARNRMFGGIMVVFDGKEEVADFPKKERSDVSVFFTKDRIADDHIKYLIEKSKNPKSLTIATDDREVKDFAKMHGAKLISSRELIDKVVPQQKEIPEAEENKDDFLKSAKAKAITEELKKKWGI
ncbi:MAG: NYN domain-containing protein [Candidatus Ratteibacteria bacterium]|nr:NYN domain-containing protein [Candidatus Ratteibacteria bacterium]